MLKPEPGPAWAAALGSVAVLFGVLLVAAQGNEALAQRILAPDSVAVRNVPADCRKDEAEQEDVSVAECELMVANVKAAIVSRPPWFRDVQFGLALAATIAGLGSVVVGMALVDYRAWAPRAAIVVFSILLALDAAGFGAAFFTGPLLRAVYLWNLLLWASIHLCLVMGAAAGRRAEGAEVRP